VLAYVAAGVVSYAAMHGPAFPKPPELVEPMHGTLPRVWLRHSQGNGPTVVVEFSDFECPYCEHWHSTEGPYTEIHRDFIETGKITFVHIDLPLPNHDLAKPAAHMSQCAQGPFYWGEMDFLFHFLQQAKALPPVNRAAREAGIPERAFQGCLDHTPLDPVEPVARALGVRVTPTFLIGTVDTNGDLVATTRINGGLTSVILAKKL
jgi:protein-disulfide isomerase